MGVNSFLHHRSRFLTNAQSACPLCNEYEEDAVHILLNCPVYYDLPQKYVCALENAPPNDALFKVIMEHNKPLMIQKLSLYIYYALKRGNDHISWTTVVNI